MNHLREAAVTLLKGSLSGSARFNFAADPAWTTLDFDGNEMLEFCR